VWFLGSLVPEVVSTIRLSDFLERDLIGIGAAVARLPLPHHPA
jgi:hypothetical protein